VYVCLERGSQVLSGQPAAAPATSFDANDSAAVPPAPLPASPALDSEACLYSAVSMYLIRPHRTHGRRRAAAGTARASPYSSVIIIAAVRLARTQRCRDAVTARYVDVASRFAC
jgi:hypothetical protein